MNEKRFMPCPYYIRKERCPFSFINSLMKLNEYKCGWTFIYCGKSVALLLNSSMLRGKDRGNKKTHAIPYIRQKIAEQIYTKPMQGRCWSKVVRNG